MHDIAVFMLCGIAGWCAYQDFVLLFISWYSGLEPPLSASAKAWAWARIVAAVFAIVTALCTL